jgi:hypothetical protein
MKLSDWTRATLLDAARIGKISSDGTNSEDTGIEPYGAATPQPRGVKSR